MTTFLRISTFAFLIMVFTHSAVSGSIPYYFQHVESLDQLLVKTKELSVSCNTDTIKCEDLETFSGNYLIKKVQAFGEFFEAVSDTFTSTFPSLVDEGLIASIDDIKTQNTALKFTTANANLSQLVSQEETTNLALKANADFTDFLSTNFHYHKSKKVFNSLYATYELLALEEKSARSFGVKTQLVEKDLKNAARYLDRAETQIKQAQSYYQNEEQSPATTASVKAAVLQSYDSLAKANNSLLSASRILLRLSQASSWEDPHEQK